MDDGDQLGSAPSKRLGDLARFDDAPPGRLNSCGARAATLGDIGHASAENAVDPDYGFIAGLKEVHETKLHPRAARAADGKGYFVPRQEDLAQHDFDFIHHLHERRVQVAQERRAQGAEDRRGHLARPRAHEEPGRRLESGQSCHGGEVREGGPKRKT